MSAGPLDSTGPLGSSDGASEAQTPLPDRGQRFRCPHCHNPIQLSDDRSDEVLCPGCGGSFRLREARATATGGEDGTVRLWDAATGRQPLTLRGHTGPVFGVAFSPDGSRLASAGQDKMVRLWDAGRGREAFTLLGYTAGAGSVAFSPDGKLLVVRDFDNRLKAWDLRSQKETPPPDPLPRCTDQCNVSPDSRFRVLAVGQADQLRPPAVGRAARSGPAPPRGRGRAPARQAHRGPEVVTDHGKGPWP
jgi:WD40 repeat protein